MSHNNDNSHKIEIGASESLIKHTEEFKKQIITIVSGVHCAIGYGLANSMLIQGDNGNIIIDTLESREAAIQLKKDFDLISSNPVVAIIYTHNHGDHIFGAQVFAEENFENCKIYSHSKTKTILDKTLTTIQPVSYQRAARQFGIFLTEDTGAINSGIGLSLKMDKNSSRSILYPTDTFDGESYHVTISGREFIFYHAPGETDDQIVIYMPKENILFAADNIYKSFPNIYAIRGTTVRDPIQWVSSLSLMRNLKSEYLIPSHTKPVYGKDNVYEILTIYRDAIQFVHDQTVRFINKGFSPDEIIANKFVQLPKKLKEHPYLQEFYGTIDWTVRSIFDQYIGWYSGKPSDLNPDPPIVRAENLIKLGGGSQKVFETAKHAYSSEKYQWCLELTEALHLYPEDINKSDIIQLEVLALQKLASLQTSPNGRNWYLTKALEIQGIIDLKPTSKQIHESISNCSLRNLFLLLTVNLNSTKAENIDQQILFHFEDVSQKILIHIRNSIVDLQFDSNKFIYENNDYIIVQITNQDVWKQIIARVTTPMVAIDQQLIQITNSNGQTDEQSIIKFIQFLLLFTPE